MQTLQRRNLILFVAGRLISLVGSGIQMIAMPLYILDQTGSGTLMGLFTLLSMVPALLASPFAGVLGDRLNRKHIAIYTDCGRGLLIFTLAGLAFGGRMSIAALFACQVLVSVLDSLFGAATAAMLPDLVDSADYGRANAARNGVDSLSMIVGPVLGGVIYGLWGVKMVFLLNAASFVVSAFCEWLIVYGVERKNTAKLTFQKSLNEIGEALSFIRRQKGLMQLFSFAMFTNFLVSPVIMVAFPFMFKKVIGFSAQQYGLLMATFMAGMLLGNVLLGSLLAKARSGRLMRAGLSVQGALFVVLMLVLFPAVVAYFAGPSRVLLGIIAAGFIITGIFNAFVNTPLQTNMQKMVPAGMRSRFFAVLGVFSQLAVPVGSVIYGFSLDNLPPHLFLLGIGVLNMAVTLFFLSYASPEAFEPAVGEDVVAVAPALEV